MLHIHFEAWVDMRFKTCFEYIYIKSWRISLSADSFSTLSPTTCPTWLNHISLYTVIITMHLKGKLWNVNSTSAVRSRPREDGGAFTVEVTTKMWERHRPTATPAGQHALNQSNSLIIIVIVICCLQGEDSHQRVVRVAEWKLLGYK